MLEYTTLPDLRTAHADLESISTKTRKLKASARRTQAYQPSRSAERHGEKEDYFAQDEELETSSSNSEKAEL